MVFNIVGRYLTGSVGTGNNKRDKNLTKNEIQTITNAGLSIFPIYQDGGYDQSYFNKEQGRNDAIKAKRAALLLGFPLNTTIYFAVDLDILDQDIDNTVIPYMEGISETLDLYDIGIYGTRNVCEHALEEVNVQKSFVSDMSSGYSGNLAFKMPNSWAFDQFIEYSIGDLVIDQVASSGKDLGVSNFGIDSKVISYDYAKSIVDNLPSAAVFKNQFDNYSLNISNTLDMHTSNADYHLEFSDNLITNNNGNNILSAQVQNGQVTSNIENTLTKYSELYNDYHIGDYESAFNKLGNIVNNGNMQVSIITQNGDFGIQFVSNGSYSLNDNTSTNMSFLLQVFIRPDGFGFTTKTYEPVYDNVQKKSLNFDYENAVFNIKSDTLGALGKVNNALQQQNQFNVEVTSAMIIFTISLGGLAILIG